MAIAVGPSSGYVGGPASSGQGTTAPVPSSGLFHQLDMLYRSGAAYGWYEQFDDFRTGVPGTTIVENWSPGWRAVGVATNGIIGQVAGAGAPLTISTEAADNDYVVLEKVKKPFILGATSPLMAFEACLKVAKITDTTSDVFVGIGDTMTISGTVPITATPGDLATEKFVGFHRDATDGDELNWVHCDAAAVHTIKTNGIDTLVADQYFTCGFMLDPIADVVIPWINGVEKRAQKIAVSASTFPDDAYMGPIFAQVAAGATPGLTTLLWIKALQARPSVNLL